jgi:hypothetical protein
MKIHDTRRYEMLVRVSEFGAAHADLCPADSLGGQMFAAVKNATDTLAEYAAAEISSRGAVYEKVRARDAARVRLLTVLEAIRRTARALAMDMPGVDGKFRLPSTQGARTLVVAARACAKDAHALSAPLLAHGLPATFLDDIDGAVLAFETAVRDHTASRSGLVAARAGIESAIQAGMTAVQRLDGIVPNRLRDDSATFAVWQQARHVDWSPRTRNSARKSSEQSVTPAPPASSAAQSSPTTPVTPESA